jgi:hypothetical protein
VIRELQLSRELGSELDYQDPNELCVKGEQGFYCVANTGVKLKSCGKKTTMLLNE